LNDDEFRDLPPRERRYEIQVADNLFFSVFPNGVKTWVLVYRFDGIVRRQTVGTFPDMRLAQALREADKEPAESPGAAPAARTTGTGRLRWWVAGGLAAVLAIATGTAYLAGSRKSEPDSAPDPRAAAAPAGGPAARADAGGTAPARPGGADAETDRTPGDSLSRAPIGAAGQERPEGAAAPTDGEIPDRPPESAAEPDPETAR
jgi:hypothetical protein